MHLFQQTIIKKQIAAVADKIKAAYQKHIAFFHNPEIQENIRNSKEEQYQEGFLRELFVNVLGYTLNPEPNFNLITEKKNEANQKKADGAILINGEVKAVIELKDTSTTDLKQIETQAFGYKNSHRKASYVITSNFEKLRFYIENTIDFEEFNLFKLTEDEFAVLWICLAYDNIVNDLPKQLKNESAHKEEQITKQFYADYSAFKRVLFDDIKRGNSSIDKLLLFRKTQKLLDRFLFIFFAEDKGLLPPNSMKRIIDQWNQRNEDPLNEYQPLYARFQLYFKFMNEGREAKEKKQEIFGYNGGLFKPDEVLDAIAIDDDVLKEHIVKLAAYDFDTEVDVNILGHIFEHSLTEIEEITNELTNKGIYPLADNNKGIYPLADNDKGMNPLVVSKRKKDGVFYTPKYITTYIVENTLGKLCAEKKAELGIEEADYYTVQKRPKEKTKQLSDKLDTYREWLLSLTICDPACGSGAFLNAALDFLMSEHRFIDELAAKLLGSTIIFPNIENAILENNLYGVDINEESVEIAKLALWLRTAKLNRKLNSLNNNIKCGNSLISSSINKGIHPLADNNKGIHPLVMQEIEKAFDWHKEFSQVFKEKNKQAFHITTAIHDSRTSERMVAYKVRQRRFNGTMPDPQIYPLDEEDELIITKTILEIVKEDKLNVLAYNICMDHLHILLVCKEEELDKIVGKIKGRTARACNLNKGINPLVKEDGERSVPLWTQKFGTKEIIDEEQLYNTIEYIQNNRIKHELPQNKGIHPLVEQLCCTIAHAFRHEYEGGFDVVIGNPPYVHLENIREESEKLAKQNYQTYDKRGDLYQLFVERGFSILKESGYISYIMPNKWLQAGYGKVLREFFLSKELMQLIDFGDIQIFEGATTYPCIFVARNEKPKSEISVSVLQASNNDFYNNVAQTAEIFKKEQFSGETWVISSQKDNQLLERLKNENITLEKFINGQSYRGVLTGLTEAFLIDEETKKKLIYEDKKASEIIKPVIRGRDISAWSNGAIESFLIGTFPSLNIDIENHASIKNHLLSFGKERLEQSGNKGCRKKTNNKWFETQDAIGYYEEFAKPKIMYQAFQVKPCFIYDENGLFCNNSMWFIPTDSKALLAVLNSKMGWWLISKYCTQIQNGYQLIWKYFGQIPIPNKLPEDLETLADKMLFLNSELHNKRQTFLRRLSDNFSAPTDKGIYPLVATNNKGINPLVKITGILELFDTLNFKQFVAELRKQKVTLSLKEQVEWELFFNEYKQDCCDLVRQIDETDKEIDGMVYGLYGLTEEDIGIIEKS